MSTELEKNIKRRRVLEKEHFEIMEQLRQLRNMKRAGDKLMPKDSEGRVILDRRIAIICRHCWKSTAEMLKVYPELKGFPVSHGICNRHWDIMLASMLHDKETKHERTN